MPAAGLEFIVEVERIYAALICFAGSAAVETPSLGGKLLYAGELDPHGRALLVAGNIAGAASLAATADRAAQKQAIRDGVADFLVNSLDEALRILKNEIRKRETVAVCIAGAPEAIEREMLERGVLPDLLPRGETFPAEDGQVLVAWTVAAVPAQWLPKLDGLAIDCFPANPGNKAVRRWICLAPRYLGRMAQGIHILHCNADVAKEFVSRVRAAVDRGEMGVEIRISLNRDEEVFLFQP
jgi:urocanate hydratase